jgi:hypothetical protein
MGIQVDIGGFGKAEIADQALGEMKQARVMEEALSRDVKTSAGQLEACFR